MLQRTMPPRSPGDERRDWEHDGKDEIDRQAQAEYDLFVRYGEDALTSYPTRWRCVTCGEQTSGFSRYVAGICNRPDCLPFQIATEDHGEPGHQPEGCVDCALPGVTF
jgi:hypothetical protein